MKQLTNRQLVIRYNKYARQEGHLSLYETLGSKPCPHCVTGKKVIEEINRRNMKEN